MDKLNFKFINDKYKKNRGGYSRLLDITCEKCGSHVCYYQKDGPGILKRMYLDRILDINETKKELTCAKCKSHLGNKIIYEKEDRLAYRLFVGAVSKSIIRSH